MSELPPLDRTLPAVRDAEGSSGRPERVVQFGTGALLRGLIDYSIDEANRRRVFDGSVVAIGSTDSGRDDTLNAQAGLYTLAVRGLDHGVMRSDYRLITAVSRALSASRQWPEVLACARNPALELVFSNTTEAGIRLDEPSVRDDVPRSFPGKLTTFLWERARHFDCSQEFGPTVLPCELLERNGDTLKEMVLTLAQQWKLGGRFTHWIGECVPFCNTLVDRIVPGLPAPDELQSAWRELGYRDELLTVCEPYHLFAIQADAGTAQRLAFAGGDPDIIVAPDIAPYRERKLRLLNAAHTIVVPLALLSGCVTVAQAVSDNRVGEFMRRLLLAELLPSTSAAGAESFAHRVLERFANPHVRHVLVDITLQQTTKLRVRVVPAIMDYAVRERRAPDSIALGFAAYLLYVREAPAAGRADGQADVLRALWQNVSDPHVLAARACGDCALWGVDLAAVEDFAARVGGYLEMLMRDGVRSTLDHHLSAGVRA